MTASSTIVKASVDIRMTSGSGMRLEAGFSSNHVPSASGEKVMCDALAEIMRLLCIAGHEGLALRTVEDSARRVREWRREQKGKAL